MSDPSGRSTQAVPQAGSIEFRTRGIGPEPVAPPKSASPGARYHRGAGAVGLAAGVVVGLNLLPWVAVRFSGAAAETAAYAGAWVAWLAPSGLDNEFLPVTVRAGLCGLAVLLIALMIADLAVPSVAWLLLLVLFGGLLTPVALRAIDALAQQDWLVLSVTGLAAVALLALVVGLVSWRSALRRSSSPVVLTLLGMLLVAVVPATAAGLASHPQVGLVSPTDLARLEAVRNADAPHAAAVRGRWTAQLGSVRVDGTPARVQNYLAEHAQLATHYGVMMVRGDDFWTQSLDSSFYLTLTTQSFRTKVLAQAWCTGQHLTASQCFPRLIATGPPAKS